MQSTFAEAVLAAFAFLKREGFEQTEASATVVQYRKGRLKAEVYWDLRSYEIGFRIGSGSEEYSTSELIRLIDKRAGDEYRDYSAKDHTELGRALERLAALVEQYGKSEMSGDQSVFAELKRQREKWSEDYALEVLAGQVRPEANDAFRKGDYKTAVRLYSKIKPHLSAAETKKMIIAQERS